jgi:hypothetical protein
MTGNVFEMHLIRFIDAGAETENWLPTATFNFTEWAIVPALGTSGVAVIVTGTPLDEVKGAEATALKVTATIVVLGSIGLVEYEILTPGGNPVAVSEMFPVEPLTRNKNKLSEVSLPPGGTSCGLPPL